MSLPINQDDLEKFKKRVEQKLNLLKEINSLQTYNRFYIENKKPKKVAYLDKKEVIKLLKQWGKN